MRLQDFLYTLGDMEERFIEEAERAYQAGKLPLQKNYTKYLAIAAALAVLLLGAVRPAALAEAARAVAQWFEDHVSYRFRSETELEVVPRYGLAGVETAYLLLDSEYEGAMGAATYRSADGEKIVYFLYGLSDGEVQVAGAESDYKLVVDTDGTELHYVAPRTEGERAVLTWVSGDGQIVFSIAGELSEEELLELRRHVAQMGEDSAETSEITATGASDKTEGFDAILAGLTEDQAYAIWQPESEHAILLVAELGTYEIDGVNGTIYCQVYGMRDGAARYLGELASEGTAYLLAWDEEYLYVAGGHFIGRYGISEKKGILELSDGLCYVPAEEGYRVRRDAAVSETFDENGEPDYISGGEWLDEEDGESLMLQMFEAYEKAEVIDFSR